MAIRPALACLLSVAFLAGCTVPSDTSSTTTPTTSTEPAVDASTYTVELSHWSVVSVQAGQNFTFPMEVNGQVISQSPHIGAHFGPVTVDAAHASKTTYPNACVHQTGRVPGDFQVTCMAPALRGTYYLRGHAQETRGNTTINWWSDEVTFDVH